nr:MAG: EamA family transporter [Caldicoprobacter oshimai]
MTKSDNCKSNLLQPLFLLILTSLLWSTGGVLIKLVNINPMTIAGFRSLFACIVFLPFVGNPFKIKLNKLKLLCAIFYAGNVTLIVIATIYTASANAILLQYTAPIYVTLFSKIFLKEDVSKREYITVAGVLIGIAIFTYDGLTSEGMMGNVLAMISGIFFAGVFILTKKLHTSSSFEPLFLGNLLAAIICSPFFFGQNISFKQLSMLLVLGVFQLGIPYVLYAFAIEHISAVQASLITTLEPILNPLWVFLATGELPSILSLIGGLIVILFITLNNIIAGISRSKIRNINQAEWMKSSSSNS